MPQYLESMDGSHGRLVSFDRDTDVSFGDSPGQGRSREPDARETGGPPPFRGIEGSGGPWRGRGLMGGPMLHGGPVHRGGPVEFPNRDALIGYGPPIAGGPPLDGGYKQGYLVTGLPMQQIPPKDYTLPVNSNQQLWAETPIGERNVSFYHTLTKETMYPEEPVVRIVPHRECVRSQRGGSNLANQCAASAFDSRLSHHKETEFADLDGRVGEKQGSPQQQKRRTPPGTGQESRSSLLPNSMAGPRYHHQGRGGPMVHDRLQERGLVKVIPDLVKSSRGLGLPFRLEIPDLQSPPAGCDRASNPPPFLHSSLNSLKVGDEIRIELDSRLSESMRTQYVAPEPKPFSILSRPKRFDDTNIRGNGIIKSGVKTSQMKSLQQREKEYLEARKRILGDVRFAEEEREAELEAAMSPAEILKMKINEAMQNDASCSPEELSTEYQL